MILFEEDTPIYGCIDHAKSADYLQIALGGATSEASLTCGQDLDFAKLTHAVVIVLFLLCLILPSDAAGAEEVHACSRFGDLLLPGSVWDDLVAGCIAVVL